jgi:hypothetical protein
VFGMDEASGANADRSRAIRPMPEASDGNPER